MTASAIDLGKLAAEVRLPVEKTRRALELLDEGNTIAFITRFRKDQTGGLDEEQIRWIQQAAARQRMLAERKEAVRKSIEFQGMLTDDLAGQIEATDSVKALEDWYLPYRPKKQTLATIARERGLEPFAREILDAAPEAGNLQQRAADFVSPDRGLDSTADVLLGVGHILAELFGERADLRAKLRRLLRETGHLVCARVDPPNRTVKSVRVPSGAQAGDTSQGVPVVTQGDTEQVPPNTASPAQDVESASEETAGAPSDRASSPAASKPSRAAAKRARKRQQLETAFQDYFDFREALSRIPHHRVLAINRGDRAKVLRVRVEGDPDRIHRAASELLLADNHPHGEFLRGCLRDALNRLVLPSLEREIRREMTERAEGHAVRVFVRNLRKLLLQPPVRGRKVLAIDPGFRSGCKLAALDAFGQMLQHDLLYIMGKEEVLQAGRATLVDMIRRHELSVVAIGNGTACRETEQLVADVINCELQDRDVAYVIVNEAGASFYSTSAMGREELPDVDPTVRSTISIGRRLLDPLSELVKINAAHLGVGMYQHDVKAKHLRVSLDEVVASCVNFVGVDVNTASPALLSYVSGLNQLTARRLYEYRLQRGPFQRREQFREVPGIGDATFVQAAGFLKITDGDNPLDATWIHPESYDVARRLLDRLNSSVADVAGMHTSSVPPSAASPEGSVVADPAPLAARAKGIDVRQLSEELGVGEWLLQDLIAALTRPARDPRDDLSPPVFRRGIVKLDDLKPGMELSGTVLNVVDFGAFVDIGISDSALIHISRLADRYIRDPHEVVSVGDILTVWVVDVDKQRRRVSLSAAGPGKDRQAKAEQDAKQQPAQQLDTAAPKKRQTHAASSRSTKLRGPKSPKRKRAKPISQDMVEGKEPMRSFSDLLQFYEQKQSDDEDSNRRG